MQRLEAGLHDVLGLEATVARVGEITVGITDQVWQQGHGDRECFEQKFYLK